MARLQHRCGAQAGTGCHEGGIILSKKPPEWRLSPPQTSHSNCRAANVAQLQRSASDSDYRSGKGEWEGSGLGLCLDDGIAGEADAELVENLAVNLAQHHGGMDLTAAELREFLKGETAVRILGAQHSEGNQHLIGV